MELESQLNARSELGRNKKRGMVSLGSSLAVSALLIGCNGISKEATPEATPISYADLSTAFPVKIGFPGVVYDGWADRWAVPSSDQVKSLSQNPELDRQLSVQEAKEIIERSGIKIASTLEEEPVPLRGVSIEGIFSQNVKEIHSFSDEEIIRLAQVIGIMPYAGTLAAEIVPYAVEREQLFSVDKLPIRGSFVEVSPGSSSELGLKRPILVFKFARDFNPHRQYLNECIGIKKTWTELEFLQWVTLHEYGHGVLHQISRALLKGSDTSPSAPKNFENVFEYDIVQTGIYQRFAQLDGWQFFYEGGRPKPAPPDSRFDYYAFSYQLGWPTLFTKEVCMYKMPENGWMRHPSTIQMAPTNYALLGNINEAFAESWATYHMYPQLLSEEVRLFMKFMHEGYLKYGEKFARVISSNPKMLETYKLP